MMNTDWEDEHSSGGLLSPRAVDTCLSDEELEAFLFNRLSGYTREVIEQHLLWCQRCLHRVEVEEDFVHVMQEACRRLEAEDLQRAVTPGPVRKRVWKNLRVPVVVAAFACILVAVSPWKWMASAPVAEITLRVERGSPAGGGVTAPAHRPLNLHFDLAGLPAFESYELVLVDASGRQEEQQLVTPLGMSASAHFKARGAGQHWVRLYTPGSARELLREYSLLVK